MYFLLFPLCPFLLFFCRLFFNFLSSFMRLFLWLLSVYASFVCLLFYIWSHFISLFYGLSNAFLVVKLCCAIFTCFYNFIFVLFLIAHFCRFLWTLLMLSWYLLQLFWTSFFFDFLFVVFCRFFLVFSQRPYLNTFYSTIFFVHFL